MDSLADRCRCRSRKAVDQGPVKHRIFGSLVLPVVLAQEFEAFGTDPASSRKTLPVGS